MKSYEKRVVAVSDQLTFSVYLVSSTAYLALKCSREWIFPSHTRYSSGSFGKKRVEFPVSTSIAPKQSGSVTPKHHWKNDSCSQNSTIRHRQKHKKWTICCVILSAIVTTQAYIHRKKFLTWRKTKSTSVASWPISLPPCSTTTAPSGTDLFSLKAWHNLFLFVAKRLMGTGRVFSPRQNTGLQICKWRVLHDNLIWCHRYNNNTYSALALDIVEGYILGLRMLTSLSHWSYIK